MASRDTEWSMNGRKLNTRRFGDVVFIVLVLVLVTLLVLVTEF